MTDRRHERFDRSSTLTFNAASGLLLALVLFLPSALAQDKAQSNSGATTGGAAAPPSGEPAGAQKETPATAEPEPDAEQVAKERMEKAEKDALDAYSAAISDGKSKAAALAAAQDAAMDDGLDALAASDVARQIRDDYEEEPPDFGDNGMKSGGTGNSNTGKNGSGGANAAGGAQANTPEGQPARANPVNVLEATGLPSWTGRIEKPADTTEIPSIVVFGLNFSVEGPATWAVNPDGSVMLIDEISLPTGDGLAISVIRKSADASVIDTIGISAFDEDSGRYIPCNSVTYIYRPNGNTEIAAQSEGSGSSSEAQLMPGRNQQPQASPSPANGPPLPKSHGKVEFPSLPQGDTGTPTSEGGLYVKSPYGEFYFYLDENGDLKILTVNLEENPPPFTSGGNSASAEQLPAKPSGNAGVSPEGSSAAPSGAGHEPFSKLFNGLFVGAHNSSLVCKNVTPRPKTYQVQLGTITGTGVTKTGTSETATETINMRFFCPEVSYSSGKPAMTSGLGTAGEAPNSSPPSGANAAPGSSSSAASPSNKGGPPPASGQTGGSNRGSFIDDIDPFSLKNPALQAPLPEQWIEVKSFSFSASRPKPAPSRSGVTASGEPKPPAETAPLSWPSAFEKASASEPGATHGGVSFDFRSFGGANIANGNAPATAGFDGAVLFPLGNRVLVGPTAGFQWVGSSIVGTIGGGPPPSTFIDTSAGFKEGDFGGRIAFPFGGWQFGAEGGATVASADITQAEGVCLTSGCTASSTTTSNANIVGPLVGAYIFHSIFSHVGVFVEYDWNHLKYTTSSGSTGSSSGSRSIFDVENNGVVAGFAFTLGGHSAK
jgi:hypothetical protein